MIGVLEATRSMTFDPGTNLKGQLAGANWLYLLPDLNVERTVCIGLPSATTLKTLSSFSQEVIIVCRNSRQRQGVTEVSQKPNLTNIRPIIANGSSALPITDGVVDLILIVGRNDARRIVRDRTLVAELQRLLKPGGLVYLEFDGLVYWLLGNKVTDGLSRDIGAPRIFWLTPSSGEMHTAVSLADRETISYFLDHELYSPLLNVHTFKRAVRRLLGAYPHSKGFSLSSRAVGGQAVSSAVKRPLQHLRSMAKRAAHALIRAFGGAEGIVIKHRPFSWFTRRYGVLVELAAPDFVRHRPPQYLRSVAKESGISLDNYRWGLWAGGNYSSRKLLFFLFNPASESTDTAPEYIVKMVRDPVFNPRLENEYRALSLLYEKGVTDRETVPQVAFFGHHGNLAIVGETVVRGMPFHQRTKASADCLYGRAAIDWLTNLSLATADPTAATPMQVAAVMEILLTRFAEIYQLTTEHYAFLADQIAMISCSQDTFPLVFQHGDPGMWNIVITQTDRVAFLDWEAAEPQGMPLWDLFYFMRSYCVGAARARGVHDQLEGFARQFLADTPLSQLIAEATGRYCDRVNLSRHLVEPLFYTCWMHRALKEATRLAPAELEQGHYVNLLRLCIEQHNVPTLSRLFY